MRLFGFYIAWNPWRKDAPRVMLYFGLACATLLGPEGALCASRSSATVRVSSGTFLPMYGAGKTPEKVIVQSFVIDVRPVTNQDFLNFTLRNPNWNKENASPLLVDEKYLGHWQQTAHGWQPDRAIVQSPVTNISWFAANEYCKSRSGRLPTVLEWEYVGAASDKKKDASHDPEFVAKLLEWYAQPNGTGQPGAVGQHRPNIWGIYDLHGLIWEWTSDFNGVFVSGDNRREGEDLKNAFCGNSAVSATDKANYAAFMRYAMRNSLKPRYATNIVGFRCAYDN